MIPYATEQGALFQVTLGLVKVTRRLGGREVVLGFCFPQGYFGANVFDRFVCESHQAIALVTTRVRFCTRETIISLLDRTPGLGEALLELVAEELEEQYRRAVSLGTEQVAGRLARLLLTMAEYHGEEVKTAGRRGWMVIPSIPHKDLAAAIRSRRPTVTNHLATFRINDRISYSRITGMKVNVAAMKRYLRRLGKFQIKAEV